MMQPLLFILIQLLFQENGVRALSNNQLPLKSRQVYVSEIYPSSTHDDDVHKDLVDVFERYGSIDDVEVYGMEECLLNSKKLRGNRRRRPYAFVTFEEATSATSAIDDFCPKLVKREQRMYRKVQRSMGSSWRRKAKPSHTSSNQPTGKAAEHNMEKDLIQTLISKSPSIDVLLQVNKSHLHRVTEYLPSIFKNHDNDDGVEVVEILESTARKKISFVFVRLSKEVTFQNFVHTLGSDKYIHKALNKVYAVGGGHDNTTIVQGNDSDVCKVAFGAVQDLIDNSNGDEMVLRIEAFPPDIQGGVLKQLEANFPTGMSIAPKGNTHVLNIARIDKKLRKVANRKGNSTMTREDDAEGCYVWGISEAFDATIGDGHRNDEVLENSDVSRAYYKLEEAFGRYPHQDALRSFLESGRSAALDCGAAPGGWTKCLLDESLCHKVYSVDPGNLSPSVSAMGGVQHLQMKLEEALPELVADDVKIDIWVSDMCLHYMSAQIDFLLESRPVLRDNAFFVMTLKCVVGHSKLSHDFQVQAQVERLKSIASGITITHLFSNRSGERTVMGFLK